MKKPGAPRLALFETWAGARKGGWPVLSVTAEPLTFDLRVLRPFAFFAKAGGVRPSQRNFAQRSNLVPMSWGLKRYQQTGNIHFITFSSREQKLMEKLDYMHRSPVRRGPVVRAEDWTWSSARHHATGEDCGVEIESQWTARRREQLGVYPLVRRRDVS